MTTLIHECIEQLNFANGNDLGTAKVRKKDVCTVNSHNGPKQQILKTTDPKIKSKNTSR